MTIVIRTFTSADKDAIVALQRRYSAQHPEVPVLPGEVYESPGFEGGRNVLCATTESGELLAFAPLYPSWATGGMAPHTLWAEVRADPSLVGPLPVKDALFGSLLARAKELAATHPEHRARLAFQYWPSEKASVDYVHSKGATYAYSVFEMARDLSLPIPDEPAPPGVTIRRWRMEGEQEQEAYVAAYSECFPEAPVTLDNWRYFMKSPQWSVGTVVGAFSGDELVGGVAVYWDPAAVAGQEKPVGFTEDVFVRPPWRRHGIARAMLCEGMRYLKEHDVAFAVLQVRARNLDALKVYQNLGYESRIETRVFVLDL